MEAPQEQLQNQVHEAEPVLEPEEVAVAEAVQGVLDRGKEVDRHEREGQGKEAGWPSSERSSPHLNFGFMPLIMVILCL